MSGFAVIQADLQALNLRLAMTIVGQKRSLLRLDKRFRMGRVDSGFVGIYSGL